MLAPFSTCLSFFFVSDGSRRRGGQTDAKETNGRDQLATADHLNTCGTQSEFVALYFYSPLMVVRGIFILLVRVVGGSSYEYVRSGEDFLPSFVVVVSIVEETNPALIILGCVSLDASSDKVVFL